MEVLDDEGDPRSDLEESFLERYIRLNESIDEYVELWRVSIGRSGLG